MCSAEGKINTDMSPGCQVICAGCTFTHQVTSRNANGNCIFEWSVTRECVGSGGETSSGTTTVPPGGKEIKRFYCDADQTCVGYTLTLTGNAAPPSAT